MPEPARRFHLSLPDPMVSISLRHRPRASHEGLLCSVMISPTEVSQNTARRGWVHETWRSRRCVPHAAPRLNDPGSHIYCPRPRMLVKAKLLFWVLK